MPNWKDPTLIEQQTIIFSNIIHFCTGVLTWELVISLPFDWSILSGKRNFRWPMTFYFACRYSMFFALIGLLVALNTTTELNCQALYTFNQFTGNSAIGTASTLFMLRTIAIWNRNPYIAFLLVIICLGHWGSLLHGMTTVVSRWDPTTRSCLVLDSGTIFLELIYFYTMSFDFIILVLTFIGLYLAPGRSSLLRLIFTDGIIYFATAFIGNLIPAVMISIDLNPVMNIMFSVPAACTASIVACRSFIRVLTYSSKDPYIHTSGPSRAHVSVNGDNRKKRRRVHTISEFIFRNPEVSRTTITGISGIGTNVEEHVQLRTISSVEIGESDISQETIGFETTHPREDNSWAEIKNRSRDINVLLDV
ncbi:hypothetical protein M422DRAFT_773308 [Sphaerobolus stellatus SS14]|nr:hypothetical protein M422DRAFT_773308 [Sphaerobolus stellatus SS14]